MNYDNFNKDEDDNNRDKEEILLHNVNIGRCDDGEFNDSHTESMSFGEFIEALATAILFILPDPYQPLGSKFEVYLLEELINAQQKHQNTKRFIPSSIINVINER